MPKSWKFEPVRWAAWTLAALTALIAANELTHDMTGSAIVPAGLTPYLLFGEVLLGLLLGKAVRDRVTPLARPRDDADTPLVPKTMVTGAGRNAGPSGMAGW